MDYMSYLSTLAILSSIMCLVEAIKGFHGSQGKEFILSFMENDGSTGNNQIYVTTYKDRSVYIQVTSPKWNNPYVNEEFYLTNGQVKEINIDPKLRMEGTGLSTKGIFINATDEVTVYGVNSCWSSSDGFLGLPTSVLGTNYYAVTYFYEYKKAEFLIAVIENLTMVNIRLSNNLNAKIVHYNGKDFNPGENITLMMDQYDTFQVRNEGDLTGSYITSNKPIAFFSGNLITRFPLSSCTSHLVEQLIPTDTWGYKFAMTSTPEIISDYFKTIASTDKTDITYSCDHAGTTSTKSIQLDKAGDFSEIHIEPGRYCFLESSYPILMVQFSLSYYADPTMILIYPIEQNNAVYTFTTPKGYEGHFFKFVTQEIHGIRLDGQPVSNMVHSTIPKTNLSGGYFNVTDGTHTVLHTSRSVVFLGILYGKSRCDSYGFPIGFDLTHYEEEECSVHDDGLLKSGKFNKVNKNVNIKSGEIWQKDGIARKLACADLCLRDCKCRGYTYHKGKKICRGHGRLTSLDSADNKAEEGFEYWAYV